VNDIGDGYSTPALVGTRIYVMSNRGMENEFVQALSTEDGHPIWTTRVGNVGNPGQNPPYAKARSTEQVYFERGLPNGLGGAVLVGDFLYGLDIATKALVAVEFPTGKVKWKAEGFGGASVTYADGQLYLHNETGDVRLVEATPEAFREKGRFTPPAQPKRKTAESSTDAYAFPVIANGRLYIRDLGTLWAYDIRASR
jgi:outer membrane protein assembly factor BamB